MDLVENRPACTGRSDWRRLPRASIPNPFAILGLHPASGTRMVRTFQPQAATVSLIGADGDLLGEMTRVHPDGLFAAPMPARKRRYRLRISMPDGTSSEIEDAYRFPSTLGELDLYLLGEGSHRQIYEVLGAQLRTLQGVAGTRFAVWAPNASRVSVIGDFNDWDGRRHVMRLHPGNGVWEIFIPGVGHGAFYKFELCDRNGRLLPIKTDPLARYYRGAARQRFHRVSAASTNGPTPTGRRNAAPTLAWAGP